MSKKKGVDFKKLIISLLIPYIASFIGSIFTSSAISTWYLELQKPAFNPPNWIFGYAWFIIYLLMGIALYLIWTSPSKFKKRAYYYFGIQWVLNILWSVIFFAFKSPFWALIEMLLLIAAVLLTFLEFGKINKKAAYLLIPYLLWLVFAFMLNIGIVLLN